MRLHWKEKFKTAVIVSRISNRSISFKALCFIQLLIPTWDLIPTNRFKNFVARRGECVRPPKSFFFPRRASFSNSLNICPLKLGFKENNMNTFCFKVETILAWQAEVRSSSSSKNCFLFWNPWKRTDRKCPIFPWYERQKWKLTDSIRLNTNKPACMQFCYSFIGQNCKRLPHFPGIVFQKTTERTRVLKLKTQQCLSKI